MKMTTQRFGLAFALAGTLFLAGCKDDDNENDTVATQDTGEISQVDSGSLQSSQPQARTLNDDEARTARHAQWRAQVDTIHVRAVEAQSADGIALQQAYDESPDAMENDKFLSMRFNVTTANEGVLQIDAVGYCETLLESRDYVQECGAVFANRLSIINGMSDFNLSVGVPNPDVRPHALVDGHAWLRRSLGGMSADNDYYFVTNMKPAP